MWSLSPSKGYTLKQNKGVKRIQWQVPPSAMKENTARKGVGQGLEAVVMILSVMGNSVLGFTQVALTVVSRVEGRKRGRSRETDRPWDLRVPTSSQGYYHSSPSPQGLPAGSQV